MVSTKAKIDLILHPVRLRILGTLAGRRMTTQEIAGVLHDVPPATLYRHLATLARARMVSVASRNRVRGAVERVYEVRAGRVTITPEDLRRMDRDDHRQMFMTFMTSVIGGYERYLRQERIDLFKDGVSYGQAVLYLSDAELKQLGVEVGAAIRKASGFKPGPGRRPRVVSTIIVPEPPGRLEE